MSEMSHNDHKKRHQLLHKSLDELFADYITHHPDRIVLVEKISIMDLLKWSAEQTKNPTPLG